MFAINSFCDRHKDRNTEVCTDIPCTWNKPRKLSVPTPVEELDFRKVTSTPKPKEPLRSVYNPASLTPNYSSENIKDKLLKLFRKCSPGAVILQALDTNEYEGDFETDVTQQTIQSMVANFKASLSHDSDDSDLANGLMRYMEENFSDIDQSNIQLLTQGQSENPHWFEQRHNRITASRFHNVVQYTGDKADNYLVKEIMGCSPVNTEAVIYGRHTEIIAKQLYYSKLEGNHKKFKMEDAGLIVHKKCFIGASPDAFVSCKCCGDGLLEVKCTFKYKECSINEISKVKYHLIVDDSGNIKLSKKSSWFTQIQGQMGVTGREWCDFVLYTQRDIFIERIYFDLDLWLHILSKCELFYRKFIIPKLL